MRFQRGADSMIREIKNKTVVICHFKEPKFPEGFPEWQKPRLVHYQVTIDPEKIETTKYMIRLGETRGDEITGWQPIDTLVVDLVLGELQDDGTVTPIKLQDSGKM